ncbi:MAG TPA: 50S ribosomal protein L25 [Clostridiales bacterium]|nr:50S ribosomal protein L25 [Clostridiales bacterium]
MAETATLNILIRDNANKADNKKLRKSGYLVGNLSIKGSDSIALAIKKDEFRRTLKQHGRNAVLSLVSDDKTSFNAMVKEVLITPPAYDYDHVDFQQVSLTEEIKAEVTIRYVGAEFLEAKRFIINRVLDSIVVKGLAQAIPDEIVIDVQELVVGDTVTVADIKFADGITPDIDADHVILTINEAKVVVEETEDAEETDEVIESTSEINV